MVDVYGVLNEGYLSGRFEDRDGVCWLTEKGKFEASVFQNIISDFIKSPENIRSFLEINNSPDAEVSEVPEKLYDDRIMDSIMEKQIPSLVDMLNGNSQSIHLEAVSTGRSVPLVVLEIVFTLREYIMNKYPSYLTVRDKKWVQFPRQYKNIT